MFKRSCIDKGLYRKRRTWAKSCNCFPSHISCRRRLGANDCRQERAGRCFPCRSVTFRGRIAPSCGCDASVRLLESSRGSPSQNGEYVCRNKRRRTHRERTRARAPRRARSAACRTQVVGSSVTPMHTCVRMSRKIDAAACSRSASRSRTTKRMMMYGVPEVTHGGLEASEWKLPGDLNEAMRSP